MTVFIGVDLGWYGKPTGLAFATLAAGRFKLHEVTRIEDQTEILHWIASRTSGKDAVVAVDAPLVIKNKTGIRDAERDLNRDFRKFHAGCHAANLGRPFAAKVCAFSARLEAMGFQHGTELKPREKGKFQIEVHPHAASVEFFDLPRIVKYKRGRRAERAAELARLRSLMLAAGLGPLPGIPESGPLKPVEDQIDAVMCAAIAAHYWRWGSERNRVYGDNQTGYVVVPLIAGQGLRYRA